MPSWPLYQDLTEEEKREIRAAAGEMEGRRLRAPYVLEEKNPSETIVRECLQTVIDNMFLSVLLNEITYQTSVTSSCTLKSKKRSVSFSNTVYISQSSSECLIYSSNKEIKDSEILFGTKETTVYTLFDEFCRHRTSGTQATASVNKCLQACSDNNTNYVYTHSSLGTNSDYCSTCTMSSIPHNTNKRRLQENMHSANIYFFGRKKEEPKPDSTGMGSTGSKTKLQRSGQVTVTPVKSEKRKSNPKETTSVQAQSQSSNCAAQTKRLKGASASTTTGKTVSIKDDKSERCPALGATKGDMVATVSHIRIGPREPCPVHGKEACQGPKCIVASSGEDQAPVKVSTMTNPRRGVFELVIRKMTGAPLAKNELMLEWTPPPLRPPPCGIPCPVSCPPSPCRSPKCKVIVCRPLLICKPKFCKKSCKRPCGPKPCRPIPCKKSSCCRKPCRPCKPCPPQPTCKPCPPSPCRSTCSPPCCKSSCNSPCKSSPCLRPCPVGRKQPRKARSQPRIESHKKRISPCCNRSRTCPVVRCRSMPGLCLTRCGFLPCLPRTCCSVAPCKPPKCCKSTCSSCCG